MSASSTAFRVGRVKAYFRGKAWYLCYHQDGRRQRPRVGPDKNVARQMAAQINGQLETGLPSALAFERISIVDLRDRWLAGHDKILRSSVATIARYTTATQHLINFVTQVQPVRLASQFRPSHAEEFAAHLREIEVAPNGHRNARKRSLRDKGIIYILESCRAMFNYACRQRHLPPCSDNPFASFRIEQIPIEDAKPIVLFNDYQERAFLEACDDWQFPIFVTLMLAGLRPGELVHLLLPDDLDLHEGWLNVRNKPRLGWQVKTRNERRIPLIAELVTVLRRTNQLNVHSKLEWSATRLAFDSPHLQYPGERMRSQSTNGPSSSDGGPFAFWPVSAGFPRPSTGGRGGAAGLGPAPERPKTAALALGLSV